MTVAVREPLGLQGGGDIGDDAGNADGGPEAQEVSGLGPELAGRERGRARQQFDDAAEQDGIEELQRRHEEIGGGEGEGDAAVAAERGDHARVDAKELHMDKSFLLLLSKEESASF